MTSDVRFFDKLDKLDQLRSQKPNDAIDEFLSIASESEVLFQYAFNNLDRTDWLPPLASLGVFRDPPSLVRDERGNMSGTYIWPQSEYLKKMAHNGSRKVQQEVLDILLEIGDTNNYHIHWPFTEAALTMPANLAARWAQHEAEWLRAGNTMFSVLADDFGKLISYLAGQGEAEIALELAAEILAILPDPDADKKKHPIDEAEEIVYSTLEPQTRIEKYHYDQILQKHIPNIIETAPFETLDLLCKLVERAIVYSLKEPEKSKPRDMSTSTRPAIEDHDQNSDFSFDHQLISTLRDTAEKICHDKPSELSKVVQCLENYEWDLFQRIVLYLLQVIEDSPVDMIEARLVDADLFNYVGVHHEYFHLMSKHFGSLSDEGKRQILDWIDKGKDLSDHVDLTIERQERLRKYGQYRHLIAIKGFLTGPWVDRYQALEQELGELGIPADFHTWSSGVQYGSKSPITLEELSEMSVDDLIDYLKTWKPSDDWMAPSPEGLGMMLRSLVTENPGKYTAEIEQFMDEQMDPTYVRNIISGIYQALESEKDISFDQIFRLCKWVVDQPKQIEGRTVPERLREDFEIDADWGPTRSEIAHFFEKVFDDKRKLPYSLRDDAWQIIELLTNDPEPDLEYEESYGGDNMDPLTLSINTVRGKALHSVMNYAMWIFRRTLDDLQRKENRTPGFRDMPEVQNILDMHLDTDKSKFGENQTDRAVYGQWLPQLVHLGEDWVRENVGRIFPTRKDRRLLREATWNSYLMYSKLYNQVYDVIKAIYREEVERLAGKEVSEDGYHTHETRLVEHAVMLYARGQISLDEGDLVDRMFRTAPIELTAHAIDFIGRSLAGKAPTEPAIVDRFKDLWEWRISMMTDGLTMADKELAAFGWWFASGQCSDDWAFQYLERTLERTGISRSNMQVFEHMNKVFQEYPLQSLRCLRLFIDNNDDPWFFSSHKNEGIWQILEQGVRHHDSDISDRTTDLVHLLGEKGYLKYRELLCDHEDDNRP